MMKKYLIAMTMLLAVGTSQPVAAVAQDKNLTEQADTTGKDALEAYSDTTDTGDSDTTVVSSFHRIGGMQHHINLPFDSWIPDDGGGTMFSFLLVLATLFIVFVMSPIGILIVLFYFINKNRKQKIQLAQMAMQQGQPIPQELLKEQEESDNELWQKGIRQVFLGIGLMIFLGYVVGEIGVGIGILVALIGAGKLFIVKTSRKNHNNL